MPYHQLSSAAEVRGAISDKDSRYLVLFCWSEASEICVDLNEVMRTLAQMVDESSSGSQQIKIFGAEAKAAGDIFHELGVDSVPVVLILHNGSVEQRILGADPAKIHDAVEAIMASHATEAEPLETKLRRLVARAPVMLFMKGSPDQPRCGFSRSIVELLTSQGIEFDFFDILQDNSVREGLKSVYQWPTYPQLYARGELIGGLDICKELATAGQLQKEISSIIHDRTTDRAG
uniref:Glutaredoxin domain-containing protein n=1 Tax=Compsopogon caeruleus TaxID=31354 RepID=A0A7S1TIV5_9RHOD|mmetsp:Transcript_8677/g.17605  ORF Transcript_8677/g.17605 Transcript_8677/m.17605 type:complete len:233 (+) Transcript_8677:95-793(+)